MTPDGAEGESQIPTRQNGTNGPARTPEAGRPARRRRSAGARRSAELVARVAAAGALLAAVVLVVLVLFDGGSTLHAARRTSRTPSGLVTGNEVLIGPAKVGSVKSIGADARTARRRSTIGLDSSDVAAAAGHGRADLRELAVGDREQVRGARAGPERRPNDPRRRRDPRRPHVLAASASTRCSTRSIRSPGRGCSKFIRGEAAAIQGRARQAQPDAQVPRARRSRARAT